MQCETPATLYCNIWNKSIIVKTVKDFKLLKSFKKAKNVFDRSVNFVLFD